MKTLLATLLLLAPIAAFANEHHDHHHGAHVHGLAKLEVALEGTQLIVRLESPLEAVLGFEHAPRSAKDKAAVAAMRKILAGGDALFIPTAAAACRQQVSRVESAVLDGKAGAGHDGHGDLDTEFRFNCAQPAQLKGLEVRLFDVFPKLRRIDAEVATGKGQTAKRLTTKMRFLSW